MIRSRVHRVPAVTCSWAVLTKPPGRRPSRQELVYEFERYLPRPAEDYACDFQTVGSEIVAVAIDRDQAAALIGEFDCVRPDGFPESVPDGTRAERFDFARGELVSSRELRLRRITALAVGLLLLTTSALVTAGLTRRASEAREQSASLRVQAEAAYARVFPADTPAGQPRSIVVQGLLREARLASTAASELDLPDAAIDLASFLDAWPRGAEVRLQQLTIDKRQATIDVVLDGDAETGAFLGAFNGLPGWSAASPTVRRTKDGQRLTIRLTRRVEGDAS